MYMHLKFYIWPFFSPNRDKLHLCTIFHCFQLLNCSTTTLITWIWILYTSENKKETWWISFVNLFSISEIQYKNGRLHANASNSALCVMTAKIDYLSWAEFTLFIHQQHGWCKDKWSGIVAKYWQWLSLLLSLLFYARHSK